MAATFNFHHRQANDVQCGRIQQAIRVNQAGAVGEDAHLYVGLLSHNNRKLGVAPLAQVSPITIDRTVDDVAVITVDGRHLTPGEAEQLALDNGFDFADLMVSSFYITHGALPFNGYLHRWTLPEN